LKPVSRPSKFSERSPSIVCSAGVEDPCVCVRNPGESYKKICGTCSNILRSKPVEEEEENNGNPDLSTF